MPARRAFTLVELLVVLAIVGVLAALVAGGVLRAREVAGRVACAGNLRQIGLALHSYHTDNGALPPGMVCTAASVLDAQSTGFTALLPYLGEDAVAAHYDQGRPWFDGPNGDAVACELKVFYCPANRTRGSIDLTSIAAQWGVSTPPKAGACDYAFNKGANGSLYRDSRKTPLAARGPFGIVPDDEAQGVRLEDITDGLGQTFAVGDAAGGSDRFPVRDLQKGGPNATDPNTGKTALLEQAWGAAGAADRGHPYYGSVFAVTAQAGANDEPMNRRPGTPTVSGGDARGDNRGGKDLVSGFRSVHPRGCNFLFCDGSVRFVPQTIRPDVYRALSTYAGGEAAEGY